jgi:hypothetical protein
MLSNFERVLNRLEVASRNGNKAKAFCPAHDDRNNPSLSVKAEDAKVLLHCFVGCEAEDIVAAIALEMSDLFYDGNDRGARGVFCPPEMRETVKHLPVRLHGDVEGAVSKAGGTPDSGGTGCTLEDYAVAKKLPVEFLRGLSLSDVTYLDRPTVRIAYPDEDGQEVAVRFRTSLNGTEKFRWRSGDKPCLYGLGLLEEGRKAGYVVLVEGESDCHTLWYHGIPALGVPGATNWRNEWSTVLEGIEKIYAVVEPDEGGEALWERLAASDLKERLYRVQVKGAKDASELHLKDPQAFAGNFEEALRTAAAWLDIAESEAQERARQAWERCEDLAHEEDILGLFAKELKNSGVAGESRTAKLLYLALMSRLLAKPVSVAVKGTSSSGKSYLVERILNYFPESAYYALTAMSERALAYSEEPIRHRFLVVYEAAGLSGDFQTYLIRSLLSEGRLRYEVVEKTSEGLKPRLIEREGPTGLIVTTTAVKLHPENETRLLSLSVADTQEQTRNVLAALARERVEEPDIEPWHTLQEWLELGAEHRVTVPFAETLAGMVPPLAVRLRRDFGAVLNLIRAHAVLHQMNRERDEEGRLVADLDDYALVRELVVDLISEGVEATVQPIVRETVEAVSRLLKEDDDESVSAKAIGRELKLEKGPVSRRIRLAIEAGYLKNLEDRRGKAARLVLGDPMPEGLQILPTVRELMRECFTVSSASEGIEHPPPPEDDDPGVDL